ncbi:hypothetical protein FWF74_02065 [Candidatus Saccharibacteria bacterium]|nr:hypothetical protein [Candidatus Saccharibacteria bacterium]MCL1963397.1 hypothetical protein [Candidatus Saccharibacteria bacterium]
MDRKLDYSAFHGRFRKGDFAERELLIAGIKTKRSGVNATSSVFGVVFGVFLTGFLVLIRSGFNVISIAFIILCCATIIIVPIAQYIKQNKDLRLLRFAIVNGLDYRKTGFGPGNDPIELSVGHSRHATNELEWDNIKMADYEYTIGHGKNSRTYHMGFTCVKLSHKVPHLLLNSKQNTFFLNHSDYKVQKLQLEGDFAKVFDLFCPPNYHVDALQIFTPDVMAVLMEYGRAYDYEFIDNEVYIYSSYRMSSDPENYIRSIVDLAERLTPKLNKQAAIYRDIHVGAGVRGVVAPEGAKLKKGMPGETWLVFGAVGAIIIAVFGMIILPGAVAAMPVIVCVPIYAALIIMRIKRR